MPDIQVDKIQLDTAMHTDVALKSILECERMQIQCVADGGNGATVDLTLHPTMYDEQLRELLLSDEIDRRLKRFGLEIKERK